MSYDSEMPVGGRKPNARNNWYHGVGGTYGTWLRGDPRGFRTFRHRLHVEGDYRNPPPPRIYEPIFESSKKRMRSPPIKLTATQRIVLRDALLERLHRDRVEVVALVVVRNHFHLLARFPALSNDEAVKYSESILTDGRDPAPRHFLGLVRKHASFALRRAGLKPDSPVWGKRPKFEPVENRDHQLAIASYLDDHHRQDGAVYHITRGIVDPTR